MIGPGHVAGSGAPVFNRIDFRRTIGLGETSPDAFDPARHFTVVRRGRLEIYAWKGSLAEQQLDAIVAQRRAALDLVAALLDVPPPARTRLVFYPDAATKLEQTGHRGTGWAFDTTLVEVYSDSVRLDPYHELTHVVAAKLGSPPAAMNEGLAVYVSERWGGDPLSNLGAVGTLPDQVVCRLRGTPEYVALEALLGLDEIGGRPERSMTEYAEAGSFVKHLVETGGLPRFRRAYRSLDADSSAAANLRWLGEIYGQAPAELEMAWLTSVAKACR